MPPPGGVSPIVGGWGHRQHAKRSKTRQAIRFAEFGYSANFVSIDLPHRNTSYFDRCSQCGQRASGTCLRCSTALCPEHQPSLEQRCKRCENQFLQKQHIPFNKMVIGGVTGAILWGGVFLLASRLGVGATLGLMTAFGGLIVFPCAGAAFGRALANKTRRRRFLEERKFKQLGEGDTLEPPARKKTALE